MGRWVFGCDICQDVCPWNRPGTRTGGAEFAGSEPAEFPSLVELLQLEDAEFRARYRHTPLWRTRRRGLARNAAIALGNAAEQFDSESRAGVIQAVWHSLHDPEPVVRGAAAWALGRFADVRARDALRQARREEADPIVRGEIDSALALPIATADQE
jgi:epoxyqueuosine reductase